MPEEISYGLKTTETLLGIESQWAYLTSKSVLGLKTTETLLGIETLKCNLSFS